MSYSYPYDSRAYSTVECYTIVNQQRVYIFHSYPCTGHPKKTITEWARARQVIVNVRRTLLSRMGYRRIAPIHTCSHTKSIGPEDQWYDIKTCTSHPIFMMRESRIFERVMEIETQAERCTRIHQKGTGTQLQRKWKDACMQWDKDELSQSQKVDETWMHINGMKDERRKDVWQNGTVGRRLGRGVRSKCFRKVSILGRRWNIGKAIDLLLEERSGASGIPLILYSFKAPLLIFLQSRSIS